MKRKEFIQQIGCTACLFAIGGGISFLDGCHSEKASITVDQKLKQIELPKDAFAEKKYLIVKRTGAEKIYIRKQEDGTYNAVEMRCTHKGIALTVHPGELYCHEHGSRFDFKGKVLEGPAKRDLKSFKVEEARGKIVLSVA